MANYTSKLSFTNHLSHLEGEEVFGSSKRPANCLPSIDNDSHCLDYVNFSCPGVTVFIVEPNIMDDVHMPQPPFRFSKLLPLGSWGGVELKENICVDR